MRPTIAPRLNSARTGRLPRVARLIAAVVLLAALAFAGCEALGLLTFGKAEPPQFVLNLEGRKPASVSADQREAITRALAQLFGTPDEPRAPAAAKLNPELLAMAAGPIGGDAQGNQRGLFRRHCVMCHGITGDGAGPAAATCVPYYPRDFRLGIFKYTSTHAGFKPTRKDLQRTLLRGLPGTSMPSFAHLRPDEIDALVEYVKYLSLRGETELYLLHLVVDGDEPLPLSTDQVDEGMLAAVQAWSLPEERPSEVVLTPPPPPSIATPAELADSVAQGRALFLTNEAQCVKCHGKEGNGKGEQTDLYDDWNKRKIGGTPEQTAELAALFALPAQELRPRDFHQGIFHGGSSPEDLYRRICAGIKGTPMAGVGPGPMQKGTLKPEEIWHIVNYVRALAAGTDESQRGLSSAGKK